MRTFSDYLAVVILCAGLSVGGWTLAARDAFGAERYVDDDAPGPLYDGSMGDPFATIQDAVDAASNGDIINVALGTYVENVEISGKTLALRGGWAQGFSVRDPATFVSIVTETNNTTCITYSGTQASPTTGELSGFTITGGGPEAVVDAQSVPSQKGGGIACFYASPTITQNVITANMADEGGGIYGFDSSPTINGNIITNNLADVGGAISFIHDSSPLIQNNIIAGNQANSLWPAGPDGSLVVTGFQICGGVHLWTSVTDPFLWGRPVLRNNTIVGNRSSWAFGGVYIWGSIVDIQNCIVWGNTHDPSSDAFGDPNLQDDTVASLLSVFYSDVEGGADGIANLDTDPQLAGAGYWDDNGTPDAPGDDIWVQGDLHLQPVSPCVDAGSAAAGLFTDYEGEPRPYDLVAEPRGDGSDNDIGADEVVPRADAGQDFCAFEGSNFWPYVVHLDGTGSIAADTFAWAQEAGKSVDLRNADAPVADFDAPKWDGSTELTRTEATLRFRLTINAGEPGERSDEIEIYIRIPGDATGDDLVNAFDLAKLRQGDPCADFTGDSFLNAFDLAILRQSSGRMRTVD